MKRSIFALLALTLLLTAAPAFAAIETQLFLDAGGGVTARIDVNTGNIVTCTGACGGLTFNSPPPTDHGTITVTGTLGQFTVNATGKGELDTVNPTRQNLNQIQVNNNAGAGTLVAVFLDTDYANLGPQFVLSASTVNDSQILGSTSSFYAYADAANIAPLNGVPSGALIGSFVGLTGLSDAEAGFFANPIGTTGMLTTRTVLNFTGAGAIQANFSISNQAAQIPEPTSVVLFGTMLIGTGLTIRRKFAKQ